MSPAATARKRTTPVRNRAVTVPSAWELDWEPISTADGNVPGPCIKPLRMDPRTGASTFLTHLPPNWTDHELDWHPATEEGYIIAGDVVLNGRHLNSGCYLFRPPGILHGPVSSPNELGATILQRTSGPLRILRYRGRRFPHRDLQPITKDYLTSDVAWSEKTVVRDIRWQSVKRGGWLGARYKWIHRNTRTGGGMVMLSLPKGWKGSGSKAIGPLEEFVLDGSVKVSDKLLGRWGYSYRPPRRPAGSYATRHGATMIAWWDAASELDED